MRRSTSLHGPGWPVRRPSRPENPTGFSRGSVKGKNGKGRGVEGEGFVRARGGETAPAGEALWFVFAGREVVLVEGADGLSVPRARSLDDTGLTAERPLYFGTLDGTPCMSVLLAEESVPDGYTGRDLRRLYGSVPDDTWGAAGLAYQLAYWADTTRFCPRTGHPTVLRTGEWGAECPSCGLIQYPRVSPCIIVLIHDGEQILMTRGPGWPAGRYGLVAGFVEPNESLEECLAREVREETGIVVDDIRYVSSQPWPFPHQLMTGFAARYAGGAVVVDRTELDDARWFTRDALPILPPPPSIARRLIDAFVADRLLTG